MDLFIEGYGCTLNKGEMDRLAGRLIQKGHNIKASEEEADAIIIFTCTVIESTQRKMERRILSYPDVPLAIAGCTASLPEMREKINMILQTRQAPSFFWSSARGEDPSTLLSWLEKIKNTYLKRLPNSNGHKRYERKTVRPRDKGEIPGPQNYAVIPIANGCRGKCTYCITKRARGKLISVPPERIVERIKEAVQSGKKEIRLSAPDTGCYGEDIGISILELLDAVLEVPGDHRVRLGMLNPSYFLRYGKDFIPRLLNPRMFRFLHVPIQSGSPKILAKMGRDTDLPAFENTLSTIRSHIPDLCFWTDVIAGFPGEEEKDHRETVELLLRLKPDVVNVTRFSPRPGTPAWGYKEVVPGPIKKIRSKELMETRFKISESNLLRYLGRTEEVLITEKSSNAALGRTRAYRQVLLPSPLITGMWYNVIITSVERTHLRGMLANGEKTE